jgi:hypothetical protein
MPRIDSVIRTPVKGEHDCVASKSRSCKLSGFTQFEQINPIGDYSVCTKLKQILHFRRIIYRPKMNLFLVSANAIDKSSFCESYYAKLFRNLQCVYSLDYATEPNPE